MHPWAWFDGDVLAEWQIDVISILGWSFEAYKPRVNQRISDVDGTVAEPFSIVALERDISRESRI